MSENRILFAISSILLLFAVNSTAQGNINCASSSCGNVRISYPFRLRSASTSCGYDDPSFELQCQNNQTIFNAGTRRYIVQDINYDYYSIRLVDPSISRANLSSCPVYSNGYDDWPSMFSNFLLWDWNMPVSFIYCLAPVNSSKYVEGPFCGNRSNIFSNSSQLYSYVMEGDRTVVSDLEESCTVDRVVWTSGRRGMRDASSLAAIYDDLAYGVELSWFRVYCRQCERTDGYCSLEERRITCKHNCVVGGALSNSSLKLSWQQPRLAAGQEECQPTSCNPSGPIIRFPFRIKARQPDRCGYPGFDLSCNPTNNRTEFQFQFPVRASARNVVLPITARATVQEIDYTNQVIRMSVVNGSCLPDRVPEASSSPSPSPFEFYNKMMHADAGVGYTLFNCSREVDDWGWALGPIRCLGRGNFRVYAYRSSTSLTERPFLSRCVKMYNVSEVSEVLFDGVREYLVDDTYLHWPLPLCGRCEANAQYCNQTDCFHTPNQSHQNTKGVSRNVVIAIVVVCVFVMGMALALATLLYICSVERKAENQTRIERKPDQNRTCT